jgi:hypothetical protein
MDMDPVFASAFFAAASVIASLSEKDGGAKESSLGLSRQKLMSRSQIDKMYRSFVRYDREEGENYGPWAKRYGVRLLGEGANRVVVQIPNGALKLAKHGHGGDSNYSEAIVWNESPQWMKKLLVPVIWNSGVIETITPFIARRMNWILMDQAYPWDWSKQVERTGDEKAALRRDLDRQRRFLQKRLGPFGIEDIRKANMSLDGRLMDYGLVHLSAFREAVREDLGVMPKQTHTPDEYETADLLLDS